MKKKKIIIIADRILISEFYHHYLINLGHEVLATFSDRHEAFEFFKENRADLVLMDSNSENGTETMEHVKVFCDTPVVYVSENPDNDNLKRSLNTEIFNLQKPAWGHG